MQLFGSLNDIASSLFKMFEFYYFVEYFIIPYTSICIRLSQLYQELCDHCVVIVNDGGDGIGGGWLIHIRVWVGGQGVCIISQFIFFYLCLCLLVSHVLPLF